MIKRKIFYSTLTALLINCSIYAQVQALGLHSTFYPIKKEKPVFSEQSTVYANGLQQNFFIPNDFYSINDNILQPPELTFESEGVNWATYQQDATILGNSDNAERKYGLNFENSYIIDNSLYSIYTTGLRVGSYISKRNLASGALEWEHSNNLNNNEKIELDFSLHERDDGNIEVYGFRLLGTNVPNAIPTGVVNRKVFDINTGEILSQHFTEFDAGGAFCINVNGQFGSTFPIEEGQTYFTNCSSGSRLTVSIEHDNNGLLIDTIGTAGSLLDFDATPRTRYTGAKRLSNGNVAVPVSIFNEFFTLDEILSEVLILSPNGELIRRIDVTEIMDFTTYMSMNVVGDKIILSGSSFQDLVNQQFILANNIAVIDEFGEVFTQLNNIDQYVSIKSTLLPSGELLVVARDITDDCTKILMVSNGELEIVHSLCHTDDQWYLFHRNVNVLENQLLISGEIVRDSMIFDTNTGQTILDGIAIAPLVLSLDLEQLGTVSTKKQTDIVDNYFTVFPNPTTDIIRVDFKSPQSGQISLINQLGELVKSSNIEQTQQHSWMVNGIASGVYYVRFENDHVISNQKIMITK